MSYIKQRKEAITLIYKFGKIWMLYDEEIVGEVMNTCAIARLKYNPLRSKESTYLIKSVRNKISDLAKTKMRRLKRLSTKVELKRSGYSYVEIKDFIEQNNVLNKFEKDCIVSHYLHNNTITSLAEMKSVSKQYISKIIKSGITKLQGIKYVLVE